MENIQKVTEKLNTAMGGRKTGATPKPKVFTCETCKDSGYVQSGITDINHPLFGRLIPCPDCLQSKNGIMIPDDYGLLPAERSLSFDNILDGDDEITEIKAAIRAVIYRGYGLIYLFGGYGTAKTLCLKVAVAEAIRAGRHAVYSPMSDIFDTIRAAYDSAKPQEEAIKRLRWYSTVDILAIDEIEKVSDSDFVRERRFQLIDRRYTMHTGQRYGITLVAGNVAPGKLEPAIASRLTDERFTVYEMRTPDARAISKSFDKSWGDW